MDAQTIRSLQAKLHSQPPPPSPGTRAHATIHKSPSAGNSLELKLHLPISAAASPAPEAMPIIIAYPVPGPRPSAAPMEVRDSAITLESVPPVNQEEEKLVVPSVEVVKEADPEEGFDVVEVSDLDGWEENKHRILRALNLPINLNKLRIMRATGTIPPPLTIFGLPKLSRKSTKSTDAQARLAGMSATTLVMETVPEPDSKLENETMETEHGETWYLPSARREKRRQLEHDRQEKLDLAVQQEHERNMAMVEEWTRKANSAYPYYGYIQNYQPVYQPTTPYYSPGPASALAMYAAPQPAQVTSPTTPFYHSPVQPVQQQYTPNPEPSHSPAAIPIAAPQPRPLAPPIAALQVPTTASPVIPVQRSPPSSHATTPAGPSPASSKRPLGYMYAPTTPSRSPSHASSVHSVAAPPHAPTHSPSHLAGAVPTTPSALHVISQEGGNARSPQPVALAHISPMPAAAPEAPVLPYKSAYSYAYDLLTPPPSILEHSPRPSARSTGG